jgi:hypothetical protein
VKEAIRGRYWLTIEKAGEAANIGFRLVFLAVRDHHRVYLTSSIDRSLLWALIVLFIDILQRRNLF